MEISADSIMQMRNGGMPANGTTDFNQHAAATTNFQGAEGTSNKIKLSKGGNLVSLGNASQSERHKVGRGMIRNA